RTGLQAHEVLERALAGFAASAAPGMPLHPELARKVRKGEPPQKLFLSVDGKPEVEVDKTEFVLGSGEDVELRRHVPLIRPRPAPAEGGQADAHLSACAQCREERDLLAAAAALIPPLPPREPRAGFAAMVALNAHDRREPFVRWLRWSLGGVVAAGVAAVAAAVLIPAALPLQRSEEMRIAQRLDLFEDLAVVQHREA